MSRMSPRCSTALSAAHMPRKNPRCSTVLQAPYVTYESPLFKRPLSPVCYVRVTPMFIRSLSPVCMSRVNHRTCGTLVLSPPPETKKSIVIYPISRVEYLFVSCSTYVLPSWMWTASVMLGERGEENVSKYGRVRCIVLSVITRCLFFYVYLLSTTTCECLDIAEQTLRYGVNIRVNTSRLGLRPYVAYDSLAFRAYVSILHTGLWENGEQRGLVCYIRGCGRTGTSGD